MLPPEAEEAHEQQIVRTIDQLTETAGIPPARRHVQMGDVTAELRATAKRMRASLVVMGAVSRSALTRIFIGNTAERVLDKLSCDVLIVKPRGFMPKVAQRRSVKAASTLKPRETSVQRGRSEPDSTMTTMSVTLPPLF
jgi:K+-sensing histidine kinase KdpD